MNIKPKLIIATFSFILSFICSGIALADDQHKGWSDLSSISTGLHTSTTKKQTSLDSLRTEVSGDRDVDTTLKQQLQLMIALTNTTVEQVSCNEEAEVSLDKLSSAERILLHTAAEVFVFNEEPPEDAGCSIYDEGVECHAFGYVCWADSDTHGCAKETC